MVFESIAQMVLNKFLQKIFFGISSKNIQFQLLQGKFVLSNIGLQPSLITNLNLPIELKHSYVERVQIHIPWREDEVTLTINISNIYVLAIDSSENFVQKNVFWKGKQAVISAALKEFKSYLQRENKKDIGFIERLLLNLLDNINIKIECIHFRYENKTKNYSFGIKVNEVSARTVDAHDEPTFFNRDKSEDEYVRYLLQMDFMGFYFNSKQDYFLCNKTLAEITDQFNRLSNIRKGGNLEQYDSEDNMDSFNYILTISLKTYIYKYVKALENLNENKDEKYLFTCEINLNKIKSRITHQQYYDMFDLFNTFSQYQRTYQQYANQRHLLNSKEKKWKDVKDLLIKKKDRKSKILKKQNDALKNTCTKYLSWVFRHAREEVIKRRFIREAIKKEITVQNVKKNVKLMLIMEKIENDKLKYWLLISLYYRKKLQEKVSVLFRNNRSHMQKFIEKYIDSVEYFQLYEFEAEINKMRDSTSLSKLQVFLKLNANIEELTFEISKESTFGVSFDIKKLKASLIVREKNYQVSLSMQDMQANVFNCKKAQKLKTYVPIIKRNCVFDGITDLLQIKYERNPIGKPFVFHQVDILFQSIQITIYPEAFKQFYQILLGDKDSNKLGKSNVKKKKHRESFVEGGLNQNDVKQFRLQKTVIRGKVKSPWVVLPLSINNDMSKECWVVRLGDFYINTYDSDQILSEEQLYYQKYQLELKRFELNYFSSINYFHNWQKFNQNMQSLSKIQAFSKQKIITMISPMSCNVDFSMLNSNLPVSIKDKNYKFIFQISIDEINIKVSKFLLTKMKYRFDIFGQNRQELNDFIETNVDNIRQENDLCGYCKISYDQIKKINFYCVLKDNYMYFFINEQSKKYHFFVNLTEVAIRLVSNQIQNFNTYKEKMVCFYLGDRQKHQNWRKKIIHLINRKDRRMDATIAPSTRLKDSYKSIQDRQSVFLSARNTIEKNIQLNSKSSKEQKEQEQNIEQAPSTKLNMTFLMNKLTIRLLDENEQQFLDCLFKKAIFTYQVLMNKEMKFSLQEWIVNETNKHQKFVSSNHFFEEQKQKVQQNIKSNNFLQIKFNYNYFTSELESIDIKVDKVFVAWKVELFTKILLYFFYEEEAGDAPSPINYNKRQLVVNIYFEKFTFYAFFYEQLIALGRMQNISLIYTQNNILQSYELNCKIFEMDKYVGGNRWRRLPMIMRKTVSNISEKKYIDNSLNLEYVLRKKETDDFEDIQKLKRKLGKDILVSQLNCVWKDSIIYFENQLTFRLLNYILNKILGTVAAKFKKRQYSPNYIFQALKVRKVTIFDVRLINFQFRMPPHQRDTREFSFFCDQMQVKRNLDNAFLPSEVQVETIRDKLKFLWESMVIGITNARLCYRVGQEMPAEIHKYPFNLNMTYSKLNFQREYFVILKHHDDIDRKAVLDLVIQQPVLVQAHKIMFVTFLQLFYQNIKHKDGLAEKFEPSLPFPSLREYNIHIQTVGLNMYHFVEKQNKMETFCKLGIQNLKIGYQQVGTMSRIKLQGRSVSADGQVKLYPLDEDKKKFNLQIDSAEGEMKVVINAQGYAIEVNLDNLNNIIEFINYDNDYVSNKIMPKKASSWQYVNFFARQCQLRLGQLHGSGQFYITYLKGMKNDIDLQAKRYLLTEQELSELQKNPNKIDWDQIIDKQIKVNGEDLKLSINEDHIGRVSNLIFNRVDITSKSTNRRYKKERVQVGEGDLYVQLIDLMTIWKVYNTYIKKNPSFVLKTLYEPWDKLPAKEKTIQKRQTQVQIQQIVVNVIPTNSPQLLLYFTIQIEFPLIIYKTYLDQQQVVVNIKFAISHSKDRFKHVRVGACRLFKLRYLNFKDRKQKSIEILNAKNVIFQLNDITNRMISCLIEEAKFLQTIIRKPINFNRQLGSLVEYSIVLVNQTNKKVRVNLNGFMTLGCNEYDVDSKKASRELLVQIMRSTNGYLQVSEGSQLSVKRMNNEINFSGHTAFKQNLMTLKSEANRLVILYRSPFKLCNKSSATIVYKEEKKIVKPHEDITFNLRENELRLELKHKNWIKQCTVDVRKQVQIIGDDCFVVQVLRQSNETSITLKDRFVLKYIPPVMIQLGELQFGQNNEAMLGFVPANMRDKYPVGIDGTTVYVNLIKDQKKIEFQKKLTVDNRKATYNLAKCEILISYNPNTNGQTVLIVYNSYSIKNDTEKDIVFGWDGTQFIIGSKESVLCPTSFDKLYFKDIGFTIPVVFKSKQKTFYSQFLKFSLITKFQSRVSVIKIEPKYSFANNSNEVIEIIRRQKNNQIVKSYSNVPLSEQNIQNQCLSLLFGKYHRKDIDIQKFGINFLEMEDLYFKLTVVEKEEQVLVILEDSKNAHKIVNNLENITITAISPLPEHKHKSKTNSIMLELQLEEPISKVVKPGEQQTIGVLNWSQQLIQLEFYYDSKNIEFKHKFTIDFNNLPHEYTHKHVLRSENDSKILFIVIISLEKDAQGRFTITAYKEKTYENTVVEKFRFSIYQVSVTFGFTSNLNDSITLQCYKANIIREKGIELQDFDIQVEKLLVREGKNISILSALNQSKFLNCHIIVNKSLSGLFLNSFFLKITPFQIICRQKIIFMILQKIVGIKSETSRKRLRIMNESRSDSQWNRFDERMSSLLKETKQKSFINRESSSVDDTRMVNIGKEWQGEVAKLVKSSKLIINKLEVLQTSIFITYTKEQYRPFDEKIINDQIIKYMLVIPSISELKIVLPHLQFDGFEGDKKMFLSQLKKKLRQSIGSTVLNALSSLPLFDSPVIAADSIYKYIDGMLSIQ